MITLRTASADDLPGAVDVFWACWTRNSRPFADADQVAGLSRADAEELWAAAWPRHHTVVATDSDDRVVGLTRYSVDDGVTEVHSLYVDPGLHSGGIGTRLLAAATTHGLRQGAPDSGLWVFRENTAAQAFYRRHGYVPDPDAEPSHTFGMPTVRLHRYGLPISSVASTLVRAPLVAATTSEEDSQNAADSRTEPAPGHDADRAGDSGLVPGAVLGCWTPADGVLTAAAGVRGPDRTPMTTDTVHDLASVTKLFTTAAVLRLVSAGEVDLDAPIDTWLPFPDPVPTVRQLLRHRGGLLPWQPLYLQVDRTDAALDLIRTLPRIAPPDRERHYSDLGFILLGAVISAATSAGLATALAELITTPLGLEVGYGPRHPAEASTSSLDDRVEQRMVATGVPHPVIIDGSFDNWRTGPTTGEANDGNTQHALGGVSGHAGLFASIDDLVTFGRAFTHTDHGLWRPETVAEFLTPGPNPEQGLGFRLQPLGGDRQLAWHPGFTGTALGVVTGPDPQVVAMATNRLVINSTPVPTEQLWTYVRQGLDIDGRGKDSR